MEKHNAYSENSYSYTHKNYFQALFHNKSNFGAPMKGNTRLPKHETSALKLTNGDWRETIRISDSTSTGPVCLRNDIPIDSTHLRQMWHIEQFSVTIYFPIMYKTQVPRCAQLTAGEHFE